MAADLATAILNEMRADDDWHGDLDVWVRFHHNQQNYAIQPTLHNGALQWLWCGPDTNRKPDTKLTMPPTLRHGLSYTLRMEDVDELMEFISMDFTQSDKTSFLIMHDSTMIFRHEGTNNGTLKKFLMRCTKIKINKNKFVLKLRNEL